MEKIRRFCHIVAGCSRIYRILKKDSDLHDAGQKINSILEDLGPTFIKFGQMLSMRSDIIPDVLANEFRKLLDHGHAIKVDFIEDAIEKEFHKPLRNVFDHFEPIPFSVASLSQVHKATLRGKKVAVKFQKPAIEKIIFIDLALIRKIISILAIFSFHHGIKNIRSTLSSISEE